MKIQFNGEQSFSLEGKKVKCTFDALVDSTTTVDVAMFSHENRKTSGESRKDLTLPGEFEVAGALIQGFYTDDNKNIVYKVVLEDTTIIHFGGMKDMPNSSFFEELGDTVDVALINLSEDFNEKKAKELLEKIEPRMAILGGDVTYFPKMVESVGAKTLEDNPIKVSRSGLSEDKTDIVILSV